MRLMSSVFFSVSHGRKRYRIKLVRYLFNTFFWVGIMHVWILKNEQNVPFIIPIGS